MTPALKIEQWPLDKVIQYPNNMRVHSREQLNQIKESIREFGFVNPCLVDSAGVLVAGHGRAVCAQELGLKKIPVIQLGHLSTDQARALRIADNAIPLNASWDVALLSIELSELEKISFDVARFGLNDIDLPELEGMDAVPKTPRKKTTIFISIKNADVEKARKAIVAALNKARIDHNL